MVKEQLTNKNLIIGKEPYSWYSSKHISPENGYSFVDNKKAITLLSQNGEHYYLGASIINAAINKGILNSADLPHYLRYMNPVQFAYCLEIQPQKLIIEGTKEKKLVELVERDGTKDYGIDVANLHLFYFDVVDHSKIQDMSLNELIRSYKLSGKHPDYFNTLYKLNETYVRNLAHFWDKHTPSQVNLEGLINTALMGFAEALERFNVGSNASFKSYYSLVIHDRIVDFLREFDIATYNLRKKVEKVQEYINSYSHEHGKAPSSDKIKEKFQLDKREIECITSLIENPGFARLDPEQIGDSKLTDAIADSSAESPELSTLTKIRDSVLKEAISLLPPEDQEFIVLRYYKNLTMQELAQYYGWPGKPTASIRHSKIIEKLRKILSI